MRYCAQCGGSLSLQWIDSDAKQRHVCDACHTIHYENPRVLVSCYVHWRDRVVFCRRAHQPAKGYWGLPGGFVEKGESLEEAAAREVLEETGIALNPLDMHLLRVASVPHMNEIYVGFRAELTSAPIFDPGPEVLEVELFAQAEVPYQELAFREMLPGYPDQFFECLRTGEFPILSTTFRRNDAS
jgi:ADP-ribose pyrophosphatase YjhB (NUDIX family)